MIRTTFKASMCRCPERQAKKVWIVGSCRGCWYCMACKGMGYCYQNTPDHLERFEKVERANAHFQLALYKEFYEAFEADNTAIVDWCCDEVHHLMKMRLKAAAERISPGRGFRKDLDEWDEEKAARLEELLEENKRFWEQAHEEQKDVAGDDAG